MKKGKITKLHFGLFAFKRALEGAALQVTPLFFFLIHKIFLKKCFLAFFYLNVHIYFKQFKTKECFILLKRIHNFAPIVGPYAYAYI